ncbi:hypothetical protein CHARACLAT_019244 [Characodon lateralis]|uniref:Arb2 domain-containing protein n=1 Tax=Characodon lateralis TaxID=208331 RepID=A0ABU7DHZ3_9TELE|nr:hypothetical protein [Characodon lateralis]
MVNVEEEEQKGEQGGLNRCLSECVDVVGFIVSCVGQTLVCFSLIKENSSSEEHVLYVWDQFVFKAAAKNIFIIAHSYGGLSFVELILIKKYGEVRYLVKVQPL